MVEAQERKKIFPDKLHLPY